MVGSLMLRRIEQYWVAIALILAVALVVAFGELTGSDTVVIAVNEMLIRMIVVVGTYIFVGNSGVLSFGHIAFMCIGAYAAGWASCEPSWKQLMLTGLPEFLQDNQYPFIVSVV